MPSIDAQISEVNRKLNALSKGLKKDIAVNKKIKRKAARPVVRRMRENAPKGKTGNLKKSIRILNLRKSPDVFVGPHARTAPHAHLVEFGFTHYRDGEKKTGTPFVFRSYNETKDQVLEILSKGAQAEFEKWGQRLSI